MATFNDVWKIGMGLPEVEETTFYGTAGLKVRGKAFCRIWSEREYERDEITDTEVLVIFCELDEKETAYPPTIENLRMIVKDKQHQKFMFDKGQAIVDTFTASAMIAVYDAMKKPEIKKKFEEMIKSKEGFMKTQAFAMKMVK